MRRRCLRLRRGWMLMEAIIVIGALSLIMASGVSLIAAVRKAHHAVTVDAANGRAIDLLARDFRRDLQRATSVELKKGPDDARLTIVDVGQNRIEYVADATGIQRSAAAPSGALSREIFRVRGNPSVTWTVVERDANGPPRLPASVHLNISLRPAPPTKRLDLAGAHEFRIVGLSPLIAAAEEHSDADN